jgi:hypothetical protein
MSLLFAFNFILFNFNFISFSSALSLSSLSSFSSSVSFFSGSLFALSLAILLIPFGLCSSYSLATPSYAICHFMDLPAEHILLGVFLSSGS